MRWLLAFWFALASALNPALAALTVNQLSGFNARVFADTPPSVASVDFRGCTYDPSNLTTFTFSSVDLGATTSGGLSRHLVIGVMAEDTASNYSLSSATVAGVSATRAATGTASTTAYANFLISSAGGTSGTVVLNFSEAITSAAICVWAIYGFSNTGFNNIVVDSTTGGAAAGPTARVSVAGTFIVAVCSAATALTGLTWGAGFTTSLRISEAESVIGYGYTFPASGTLNLSCDPGGGDVMGHWLYATPL